VINYNFFVKVFWKIEKNAYICGMYEMGDAMSSSFFTATLDNVQKKSKFTNLRQ